VHRFHFIMIYNSIGAGYLFVLQVVTKPKSNVKLGLFSLLRFKPHFWSRMSGRKDVEIARELDNKLLPMYRSGAAWKRFN
jgi:hypothetical protein